MSERNYYLGFSLVSGIGSKTFNSLFQYFKTAKNVWFALQADLGKAGLSERLIIKFEKERSSAKLDATRSN